MQLDTNLIQPNQAKKQEMKPPVSKQKPTERTPQKKESPRKGTLYTG